MGFMRRLVVILAIITASLMVASGQADAISQTFQVTSDHATGGLGTPPFGTVQVAENGANLDVTVHVNSGWAFVKTGSVDFQAFKFNATGVALTDISINAHTPALGANTGAFNGDGTGNFGFGIDCPTCANGGSGQFTSDIVFHIANAVFGDITAPNALGNIFVLDLINLTSGNTGPADVNVPEPSALLLAGTALLGIGYSIRNRFRRTKKQLAVA
jgi:hypothetical protein